MKFATIMVTCMMFFTFSITASADLTNGLKLFYTFDGDADDKSGNGNHGWIYDENSHYHFNEDIMQVERNDKNNQFLVSHFVARGCRNCLDL